MIKTFRPSKKGWDYTLYDWDESGLLYKDPAKDGYRPYKKGEKVTFKPTTLWSFGCGSVFNWIDNTVYSTVFPDRENIGQYILQAGGKYCAGKHSKKRSLFIDGDWYYEITGFKSILEKGTSKYGFSFKIASDPIDTPSVIKQINEQNSRKYYGECVVGDFAFTISHAHPSKRKWLNKKQFETIRKTVEKTSDAASETCVFEV